MSDTTLKQLAILVNGNLDGDSSYLTISGAATLATAGPSDITFVDNSRFAEKLQMSTVAAAVVSGDFPKTIKPTIRVEDPRSAFAKIVAFFRPQTSYQHVGISVLAIVSPTATIGEGTNIHPRAQIGDDVVIGSNCNIFPGAIIMPGCRIDDDVTIFPNVVLYEATEIGPRVMIHASTVIGAYGFGYDTVQGRHNRGDQLGHVKIEADVEIGANSTIDRGTYGPTIIGEGTKIDNLVMIAHNCRIGKHNLICSQVGVAGSSTTGDYVVMAGQVGVPDHVTIGNRSVIGAKSGIMRDLPDDSTVIGIPATPERDQMAKQAALAKLPEMRKQLRKLQKTVDELTESRELRSSDAA